MTRLGYALLIVVAWGLMIHAKQLELSALIRLRYEIQMATVFGITQQIASTTEAPPTTLATLSDKQYWEPPHPLLEGSGSKDDNLILTVREYDSSGAPPFTLSYNTGYQCLSSLSLKSFGNGKFYTTCDDPRYILIGMHDGGKCLRVDRLTGATRRQSCWTTIDESR